MSHKPQVNQIQINEFNESEPSLANVYEPKLNMSSVWFEFKKKFKLRYTNHKCIKFK